MERLKAPFMASFSRRAVDDKVETKDGKHRKIDAVAGDGHKMETIPAVGRMQQVGSSGGGMPGLKREGSMPEETKSLTLKEYHLMSEQRESIPDGRVTEGDQKGGNWIMETSRFTSHGWQCIKYTTTRMVGSGSFGVVFQAICVETGQTVAIKRVLQDRRFKNRELQIMRMVNHPNVVQLLHSFASVNASKDTYLNLVCEFVPDTVHRVCRQCTKAETQVPMLIVKLYVYQMCRALAAIHKMGICHRDIKPQNLLVDPKTHQLKLCDFGSAKVLIHGGPNISYICSRYYRAPELIFGATEYTTAIDVWSLGCVMAELLIGSPMFPGESGVDQLLEIIKILGTPTKEEIISMNPNYTEFKLPQLAQDSLFKMFKTTPKDAVDLLSKFLVYTPSKRISLTEALAHPFFDELRDPATKLPNGKNLPPLFNWINGELDNVPQDLLEKIRGPRS